jgi:serpin B
MLHCSDTVTDPDPDPEPPRELTQAEIETVNAFNEFGFELFSEINRVDQGDSNMFISPFSVSMSLGMTMNGARGTTEDAMKSTLGFGSMDMVDINEAYEGLMELLPGLDPDVLFEIANSIWYRVGDDIREEFLNTCGAYFDADVAALDFGSPDAASTINEWVDDKTNGKIEKIVSSPIAPHIVMFLINAIYFKGTWTEEFDPSLTEDDLFTLPSGEKVPCRMMRRPGPGEEAEFECYSDGEVHVLDLPYADGWYTMTIVMPWPHVEMDNLIAGLDVEKWNGWTASLMADKGTFAMPRFETTYEIELKEALAAMGMEIALDQGADFSGIRETGGLWIDKVKHKTYVRVDEAGTEAAAVTATIPVSSIGCSMRVDRPFLFAIREKHSGTVLFIGKIVDPGYLD